MNKGLDALKQLKKRYGKNFSIQDDERTKCIEKELKALEEIMILYHKWLGNEYSDFEFFTLLNDKLWKYDLLKEVLL